MRFGSTYPPATLTTAQQRRARTMMAYVFAASWFVSTAKAAHLPQLLQASGASLVVAVGVAALVGPAQVAGRLIEFGFLRQAHPLLAARIVTLAHRLGATCRVFFGAAAAPAFAVLHGLGNGILTISMGTLPLMIFGSKGYGQRQGVLMVPARVVHAAAPLLFGVVVQSDGAGALWVSACLGLGAFVALASMHLKVGAPH